MSNSRKEEVEARARALFHGRFDQGFPVLNEAEIARIRRFGSVRRFADGEALFETGKPRLGMLVVLSGSVSISAHDGLGHVTPLVDQGPGQFIAEIGTLADNAPAIADGYAEGDVEVLVVPSDQLRELIVEEADLGERIMRALVLRRVAIIELGEGGPIVIGRASSPAVSRLENFLGRNAHPHRLIDPDTDPAASDIVRNLKPAPSELPLVISPAGEILRNPSETVLARSLGLLGDALVRSLYDVAIVGSGPAGLATAVYGASEGLSVVVFEARAFGGQAGASARIENYFGFPTGISGMALTGRAFVQARKFGAEIVIPSRVTGLERDSRDGLFTLVLDDGRRVRARAVVAASGATYRRPAIENLAAFEGRGVWYWASPFEGALCAGREVVIVGGGNSAGQAAVFLAQRASRIRILLRGPALGASMSRYLVTRIEATENIEVIPHTEIIALDGAADTGLEHVRWRSRRDGTETTADVGHLFVFIGADPATEWLRGCGVALDPNGFVITGAAQASPLATNVPGLFAIGDVRLGSTKRVGSAIGEGAQVVVALHAYLADAVDSISRAPLMT